jgi:hypothetical protein
LWARLVYLNKTFTPADKSKIMFVFYQIATQAPRVNDVAMPTHPDTATLIERLSVVVSFGMQNVATTPLECVGLDGYRSRLLFWMVAPVVVAILIVPIVLISLSWKKFITPEKLKRLSHKVVNKVIRKPKPKVRRPSVAGRFAAKVLSKGPVDLPPPSTENAEVKVHAEEERKTLVHHVLPGVLVTLFVFYPRVTFVAFEGFPCHKFVVSNTTTRRFLRADVDIDCDSYEGEQVRQLAWTAIVMYPIGVLIASAAMLWMASDSIAVGKRTHFSNAISFLYVEYDDEMYWWELMEMLRKFILVGLMVLIAPGTLMQISIGTITCAAYLVSVPRTACWH